MIDPALVIGEWNRVAPEIKLLVDLFVSPKAAGRRFVLGRNEHSEELSRAIDIDGFVDDFAESDTVWNGKPVLRGEDVPKNAIVVNCSMSILPTSAHKRILGLGVSGTLAYSDLCKVLPGSVALPNFVSETRSDIKENQIKWKTLHAALFDDESRQVLNDVLQYRLTADYSFMRSYSFRPKDQYWEDFLRLNRREIFVDAGGYDGDTTEEFCSRYPDYEKVFFFEPSSVNLEKARARLRGYRSIEFIQLGLSDSVGSLMFNPDKGSASAISESGSCQIDVTTLDKQVDEKVTFIKTDLEGWDLKALMGSKRHIIEENPNLAISVYHHPSDFWRIFEFVVGLRRDYNVFLRHYTEGWSETIMFFIPEGL